MKQVFNSLGVQYTAEFCQLAWSQLFAYGTSRHGELQEKLEETFAGKALLTYKGRDAIELAVRLIKTEQRTLIFTQAFTCGALEEAIDRAGAVAQYVDIGPDGTNMTVDTLDIAYKQTGQVSAVIVQHSLGMMADMPSIQAWCKTHNCVLIEDVAQGYGAVDAAGKLAGTYADITICSFGRDKILDAVSGGACIVRNSAVVKQPELLEHTFQVVPVYQVWKDMLYPVLTRLIRQHTPGLLGSSMFRLGKITGVLSSPILSPFNQIRTMADAHVALVLWQLSHLKEQLEHRRHCMMLYALQLQNTQNSAITILSNPEDAGSALRCVVCVQNVGTVARRLDRAGIHVTDRWYRSAVDTGQLRQSSYQEGSCPMAEKVSQQVLNLPTHTDITDEDITYIINSLVANLSKTG